MWLTVASVIAAGMLAQQTDTTFPVRPGSRLELENFGGETVIRTWDRASIRIQADYSGRERIEVRSVGTIISVKAQGRGGGPRAVDFTVTVPVRTDLSVSGVYQDVSIQGVQGAISVETVNGDVDVEGGAGQVQLRSVEGAVRLMGASGRISVSSVNDGVVVRESQGEVQAESVNGDVELIGVTASVVDATTVNGDVSYDGPIQDAGQYSFNTHNGDITVAMAETANATVSVSTFSGEFESTFPVRLTETRRNRFSFVLGSGSARVSLESFQGEIRLARPGDLRGRNNRQRERNRD